MEDIFFEFWAKQEKLQLGIKRNSEFRPAGLLDDMRVEMFQKGKNSVHFYLEKKGVLSEYSGSIYKAVSGVSGLIFSIFLAVYDENIILWLDNHFDDSDFANFIRREQLIQWLPDNLDRFLEMVVLTKLNYLGRCRLINNLLDIPGVEKFTDEEKLNVLKEQVRHPNCVSRDGGFQLTFFVWSLWTGRVIHYQCQLSKSNFIMQGSTIAAGVGRVFVPR